MAGSDKAALAVAPGVLAALVVLQLTAASAAGAGEAGGFEKLATDRGRVGQSGTADLAVEVGVAKPTELIVEVTSKPRRGKLAKDPLTRERSSVSVECLHGDEVDYRKRGLRGHTPLERRIKLVPGTNRCTVSVTAAVRKTKRARLTIRARCRGGKCKRAPAARGPTGYAGTVSLTTRVSEPDPGSPAPVFERTETIVSEATFARTSKPGEPLRYETTGGSARSQWSAVRDDAERRCMSSGAAEAEIGSPNGPLPWAVIEAGPELEPGDGYSVHSGGEETPSGFIHGSCEDKSPGDGPSPTDGLSVYSPYGVESWFDTENELEAEVEEVAPDGSISGEDIASSHAPTASGGTRTSEHELRWNLRPVKTGG